MVVDSLQYWNILIWKNFYVTNIAYLKSGMKHNFIKSCFNDLIVYRVSFFARFEIIWLKPQFESSCKKCQYCDKELQYFRGSIGYANLSQVCWKKLFLHPWQVAHIDIFVHMFLPVFNIELFLKLKDFCSLSAVLCLSYILINPF